MLHSNQYNNVLITIGLQCYGLRMVLLRSDGAGNAALYRQGLSGVQLCDEPDHVRGGPSAPLYNYASTWLLAFQHAQRLLRLCMPLTQLLQSSAAMPHLHILLKQLLRL